MSEFNEYIVHGEPGQKKKTMLGKRQSVFMNRWVEYFALPTRNHVGIYAIPVFKL